MWNIKLYGGSCAVLFYDSLLNGYSYAPIGCIEDTAEIEDAVKAENVTVTFKQE